jgi:hypothetical protein
MRTARCNVQEEQRLYEVTKLKGQFEDLLRDHSLLPEKDRSLRKRCAGLA